MLVLQPPTLICFVNRWHQDSSSSRGRWCWLVVGSPQSLLFN